MGMVVRTNTMAMNANRQLSMNNSQVAKSLEKLSSGFRINRAADDASGLAISEKMKAQIKGLEQASANSQDGISLIQTAEGGLTEVHNMLNRMVELATKSANGTIRNEVDREAIQTEVDALNTEITRISKATNFNGINLLDGSLSTTGKATGGSTTVDLSGLAGNMLSGINTVDATKGQFHNGTAIGDVADVTALKGTKYEYTFEYTDNDGNHQVKTVSFELAQATGAAGFGAAANDIVYKAADGSEYAVNTDGTTAGTTTKKAVGNAIRDAIISELSKDADFSANFKAVGSTTDGQIDFTAVNAGSTGAELKGMVATTTTTAGAITNAANGIVVGNAGTSTAVDSFKTLDLANATIWDGTQENLDKAAFEINGEKFVFVNNGIALTDAQKTMLADAGVGNNYITTAGADTIAAADVTGMAAKIAAATGLKVETGELDVGATNTWDTTAAATTTLALKDAVTAPSKATGGLTLQIGDTNEEFNKVTVSVDDMSAKGIGTEGLNVSDQDAAGDAIDVIKAAINKVSTNRANLGALQNRLEYTINNLDTTAENMNAANSRIRDTDMAKEMMNYTKMNILTQAAQAMLAQANQQPQAILQLLQ